MAYSYDQPMVSSQIVAASVTLATQPDIVLPCQAVAALAHANGSRILNEATVLGLSGIVTTVGTGVITIGDGAVADRYGTFTLEDSPTLNGPLRGTLVLTEEGFRMGVSDVANTPTTFVIGFSGTAVVDNLSIVIGRF